MREVFLICCLLVGFIATGQFSQDTISLPERKKPRIDVTFGTAFSTGKYGGSYGMYISPRIAYPLTDRFSIRVGGLFRSFSPLNGVEYPTLNGHPFHSSTMQSLLMVEGAYRVNQKLTLTGMVYREIPFRNRPFNNPQAEAKGMIMGIDYRVNDHVFIRGEIEISNDRSPYMSSPFFHHRRNSVFDPFFRGQ